MKLRRFFSVILSLTLILPQFSAGQVIAGISATVGLDDRTLDLLNRLPKEVREEIVNALRDALPILDKSVNAYLAKVNEILDRQINHAQCSMTGVVADVARRAKLGREKGPLELFDEYEKNELGQLKQSSTAASYATVTGDISYEATVTYCEMQISTSAMNISGAENKYRKLNFIWFRLKDSCGTAIDCLQKQLSITDALVKNSDRRDVQAVDAARQLSAVRRPVTPRWFTAFDPKPYESALSQLLNIQDELSLAKLRRVLSQAKGRLDDIDAEIALAKVALQSTPEFGCWHNITAQQVGVAKSHADAARKIVEEIDKSLAQNLTDAETHQGEVTQSITGELGSRRTQIEGIDKSQPKRWQDPSPCQLRSS
jgi:hypothetical protein